MQVAVMTAPGSLTPGKLLRQELAAQRPLLLLRCVLLLAVSIIGLVHPWLAGSIAAALIGESGAPLALTSAFSALVALLAVQAGVTLAQQWLAARTYNRMAFALRTRLYDRLLGASLGRHQSRSRSEALTLIERDAEDLTWFVNDTLVSVVPALATLAGAAAMLIRIDWAYGATALTAIPVYVVVLRLARRRLSRLSRRYAEARSQVNTVADEQLAMLPVVKAFGREDEMGARFRAADARLRDLGQRLFFRAGALGPLAQLSAALGVVVLLWRMSQEVAGGQLPVAQFLVFFLYAFAFTRPLSTLAGLYGAINKNRGCAERLVALLNEASERTGGESLVRFDDAIRLEGVRFGYAGRPPVLDGVDLEFRRGEVSVLLGANGAGKSTVLKLLLGFLEPEQGRVSVDGRDVRTLSLASLRSQFAVVPQELMLLGGSIYDNIALGSAAADRRSVLRAAEQAHAHAFIAQLPDGYQTRVGEGGVLLSGGQRQRLALARALVKQAPILILDEATSMLDAATEAAFFESCRELFRERTVIVVSHQLSDLGFADRVVRLAGGRAESLAPALDVRAVPRREKSGLRP